MDMIKNMTAAGAQPKGILAALRYRDQSCNLIMRDIYNAKKRFREQELHDRIPMEVLLEKLVNQNVNFSYQMDDQGRVSNIFIAPISCIKLAKEFHHVMLLDATYKTKKHKMRQVNMAGLSSGNNSFCIAFCLMSSETAVNYRWALRELAK